MSEIQISNPQSEPFGRLSNNFIQDMNIDRIKYKSITNYMVASMFDEDSIKRIIGTAPIYGNREKKIPSILNIYDDFTNKKNSEIIKGALDKAVKQKFQNPAMKKLLLSTGNSDIIYVSNSHYLGIGADSNGQNLYGDALVQERHRLFQEENRGKQNKDTINYDNRLYNIYLANFALERLIKDEYDDLSVFLNKSISEILQELATNPKYSSKYTKEKLLQATPIKIETFTQKFKSGNLENINLYTDIQSQPNILAQVIRKSNLKNLFLTQEDRRKKLVFDMFLDYIISKNSKLKKDQYSTAKRQQIQKLSVNELTGYKNRTYDAFEKGLLSINLTDSINEKLKDFPTLTEDDVKEAEKFTVFVAVEKIKSPEKKFTLDDLLSSSSQNSSQKQQVYEMNHRIVKEKIFVYPAMNEKVGQEYIQYVPLSPAYHSSMIKIDNNIYPTISHYIFVCLINSLKEYKQRGYEMIKIGLETSTRDFLSLEKAGEIYTELNRKNEEIIFNKALRTAFDIKFRNIQAQNILLKTGTSNIRYIDNVFPQITEYTRVLLLEKRDELRNQRKENVSLSTEDIENFINKSEYIEKWIIMKVKDMMNTFFVCKNYLSEKYNSRTDIKMTEKILDTIYEECSHIFSDKNNITMPVPNWLKTSVIKNLDQSINFDETILLEMWKRVVVLFSHFMKSTKTEFDVEEILNNAELSLSGDISCEEFLRNDRFGSCIVSAIVNLLKRMSKLINTDFLPTLLDISVAVRIILNNQDISDALLYNDPLAIVNLNSMIQDTEKHTEQELEDLISDIPEEIIVEVSNDEVSNQQNLFNDDDDEHSPPTTLISLIERSFSEQENMSSEINYVVLSENILEAVKFIKAYKKIPNYVKINRVNFFSY